MPERLRRALRAVRAMSVHTGCATISEIARPLGVATEAHSLALVQDLVTLVDKGLLEREISPYVSNAPAVWRLTAPGRELLASFEEVTA